MLEGRLIVDGLLERARAQQQRIMRDTAVVYRWEPVDTFDPDEPGRTGEWVEQTSVPCRHAPNAQRPVDREVAGRTETVQPDAVTLPAGTDVQHDDRIEVAPAGDARRTVRVRVRAVHPSSWQTAVRAIGEREDD